MKRLFSPRPQQVENSSEAPISHRTHAGEWLRRDFRPPRPYPARLLDPGGWSRDFRPRPQQVEKSSEAPISHRTHSGEWLRRDFRPPRPYPRKAPRSRWVVKRF